MNLVECAHLKDAYNDMLMAKLLVPISRQVLELYAALDYKYHNLEFVLKELVTKDATHFQAAHNAVLTKDVELLLGLVVKAQHVLINKGMNNVPVMTSLELITRLYQAIFQELLDSLDLIYHRCLKTRKIVMKIVRRNIASLAASVVPVLEQSPQSAIVQPVANYLANSQLDDLLNTMAKQQKDIQLASAPPLPITPTMPSAAAPATAPAVASASTPKDLKQVIMAAASETAKGGDGVKEFHNYD